MLGECWNFEGFASLPYHHYAVVGLLFGEYGEQRVNSPVF